MAACGSETGIEERAVMLAPPYDGRMSTGPRYRKTGGTTVCEDCGVVVAIREAHTRYHAIESSWAWTLAVLKTSHIAAHVHDRYDTVQRIDARKFDNWSADAFAEVTGLPAKRPDDDSAHTIAIHRNRGGVDNAASILITVERTEHTDRKVTWITNENGTVVAALIPAENYRDPGDLSWLRDDIARIVRDDTAEGISR
jgi:hypothetical protein